MTGNDTYRDMFGELLANLTFEASSKDGCSIVFSAIPGYKKVLSEGGGWWAPSPYRDLSSDMKTRDASVETCAGRSMVLVVTALDMVVGDPYTAKTPRFDAELLLCSSKYFSSKVDATVAINQTSVTVMFDVDDYYRTRRPLSEEALNSSSIEQAFFASGWSERFGRNPGSLYNNADGPWYGGPLSAIAAGHRYNEDPRKLQNLTSLLPDMKAMFQQFFGEKLLESWTQSLDREFAIPDAKVTVTKARIIASEDVGFSLAVLLLCSGLLISGVEAPQMSAVSCKPRIEAAKSLVTIDIETGVVYEYEIIGTLRNVSEAWSWPYSQKNVTRDTTSWDDDGTDPSFEDAGRVNSSTTFGIFFKHFANWNITWDADWTGYTRKTFLAAIMSMSILVFLIFVTIIMFTTNRHKYKAIPRDVNTLASILGWVYASDRLLAWSESAPPSKPWYQTLFSKTSPLAAHHRVKTGPFIDSAGNERWGIEMVETETVGALLKDEEQDQKSVAGPAGESIELQHINHTAIDGSEDLAVHERLLSLSDIESETVNDAHESVKSTSIRQERLTATRISVQQMKPRQLYS
ncbi:hypothetical protein D6C76_07067 [Aureobasidium pullulans]|nr:hypothetical protein D6C76_07067 [Aureobasidium pullulans]